MADYYAILKKAVGSLDPGPVDARRAVYDRARNVVADQFKATDRSAANSRQRLQLEAAIRRVELETVAEGQEAARHFQPAEAVPTAGIVQPPVPPPQSEALSPRDIFRQAIRKAEARATAAGNSKERAAERPTSRHKDDDAAVASPGDRAQGRRAENQTETNNVSAAARLASEDDRRSGGIIMSLSPVSNHDDRLGRVTTTGRQRQGYLEDASPQAVEWPVPPSRWPTTLLFGLMVGAIVGLGLLAWSH